MKHRSETHYPPNWLHLWARFGHPAPPPLRCIRIKAEECTAFIIFRRNAFWHLFRFINSPRGRGTPRNGAIRLKVSGRSNAPQRARRLKPRLRATPVSQCWGAGFTGGGGGTVIPKMFIGVAIYRCVTSRRMDRPAGTAQTSPPKGPLRWCSQAKKLPSSPSTQPRRATGIGGGGHWGVQGAQPPLQQEEQPPLQWGPPGGGGRPHRDDARPGANARCGQRGHGGAHARGTQWDAGQDGSWIVLAKGIVTGQRRDLCETEVWGRRRGAGQAALRGVANGTLMYFCAEV